MRRLPKKNMKIEIINSDASMHNAGALLIYLHVKWAEKKNFSIW